MDMAKQRNGKGLSFLRKLIKQRKIDEANQLIDELVSDQTERVKRSRDRKNKDDSGGGSSQ